MTIPETFVCSHDTAVRRAAVAGSLPDRLHAHAQGCRSCQETLRLVEFMRTIHRSTEADAPVAPSYQPVWMRAQLLSRLRRQRVIATTQLIIRSCIACALVVGLVVGSNDLHTRGLTFGGVVEGIRRFIAWETAVGVVLAVGILLWLLWDDGDHVHSGIRHRQGGIGHQS